jgi:hypothetical protein
VCEFRRFKREFRRLERELRRFGHV